MNADDYNQKRLDSGLVNGSQLTALTLHFQKLKGLEQDGKFGPNTASAAVAQEKDMGGRVERARRAVGRRTKYILGKGGWNPSSDTPGKECDCSGFVSWVIGKPRNYKYGSHKWISTSDIYSDAKDGYHLFREIEDPEPGCIVVYGDSGGRQGHCAIVTKVEPLRGIDCSSSQSKRGGDAITERDISFFEMKNSIFVVPVEDD
tara:strand:- start:273 stop:881 length:609 start_codon:yes stop_codon:yes gene_type:complete